MRLVVARKRLPTPFALRNTKPNPTVVVLPVLAEPVEENVAHVGCGRVNSGNLCSASCSRGNATGWQPVLRGWQPELGRFG
jgi:hypothetical protein